MGIIGVYNKGGIEMSKKNLSDDARLMADTIIRGINRNAEYNAQVNSSTTDVFTPELILDKLKEKVIGNEELLYKLSSIGSIYSMCIKQCREGATNQEDVPRLFMFVSGKTGTGKTYSVQTLSKILGIPYLRIDCSSIVPHGADGNNIKDILVRWKSYTSDPSKGGLIFLDELDKTSYVEASNNTEWKKSIQYSLLDLLDGVVEGSNGMFNNLLIIGSGSFQCHREAKENIKAPIGFVQDVEEKERTLEQHRELLIAGGLIPELAGRFLDIVETAPLTKKQIRSLLFNANSVYSKYCALNHNNFFLEANEVDGIIEKVQQSKVGMRELEGLIFNAFCGIINKGRIIKR